MGQRLHVFILLGAEAHSIYSAPGPVEVNGLRERKSLAVAKSPFAVLIVLGLFVGGGLFYWYEYRPSVVRAKCSMEAEKRADKDEYVYEIIYRHCLRSQGIEYTEPKE